MPTVNVLVTHVVLPLDRLPGAPNNAPSAYHCTVPVGVPMVDVTAAVKVIVRPTITGLGVEASTMLVAAGLIVKVCETASAGL